MLMTAIKFNNKPQWTFFDLAIDLSVYYYIYDRMIASACATAQEKKHRSLIQ